ncbi:MAG: DUF1634 domain-containing protein [Microcystaceae cyanobacterium]
MGEKTSKQPQWTERQIEQIIGNLLRGGVMLAASVVAVGGIFYLIGCGGEPSNYKCFRGEPEDLRTLSGIMTDVFALRRPGLIQFGLLLLIATPIVRVIFSVLAFAKQGDRLYVIVTLIVLAILVSSLVRPL